ncbi:MAG: hypothetical protein IPK79_11675 [Vampirovibrionales bacterium]|nr:hypothetical protein [Vampirovibrionales bacterium]
MMGSIAGISPAYGAAMVASQGVFNAAYGRGLAASFGGNVTPGPINSLINNYLGPQLTGGGYGNLAGLLPNYMPGSGYSAWDYTFGAQAPGLGGSLGASTGYGGGYGFTGYGYGPNFTANGTPDGYGPFMGWGSQSDGRFPTPFPTSPFELSMGHHADPYFPGGVRGGAADLMAMLTAGFNYLAREIPLGSQHYVMGGPIIEALA